jgi:hypothetical protein
MSDNSGSRYGCSIFRGSWFDEQRGDYLRYRFAMTRSVAVGEGTATDSSPGGSRRISVPPMAGLLPF